MRAKSVTVTKLSVLDDVFFTEERFREWYNILLNFASDAINILYDEIGNIDGVTFEINQVLLKEVIYDAIIGLKTIVVSDNNTIKEPNPFKIAAYLGYWFLRHKPIIFRASKDLDIDNIVLHTNIDTNQKYCIILDIKHINEIAVSRFLLRYIFDIDSHPVCGKLCFKNVKKNGNFYFDNFNDMMETIYEKLKYYLTYREISPKIIEHFLEAYTLHPYFPYTCNLWDVENE